MKRLEVSGAVRPLYWSLGVKELSFSKDDVLKQRIKSLIIVQLLQSGIFVFGLQ